MTDKTDDKKALADTDALDTLSLSLVELGSSTLRNARLIKNARMETTVELYNDPISGSLQIYPDEIRHQLSASERDQEIVNKLANLPSYDVYSLRAGFRSLGLTPTDADAFNLSDDMRKSLEGMTVQFTRPLIENIFGSGGVDAGDSRALQKIFRDADPAKVLQNLKMMTEKTGIPVVDLPAFLSEYSELFLSVAYYRHSYEGIAEEADRFLTWVKELREHRDVTSSKSTAVSCKKADESMRYLIGSIRERLMRFQANFELFWKDINKDSFKQMREQIEENHATMGAVLCGLNVKLRNWAKEFPDNTVGGPQKRSKYVVTEIEPGLESLRIMEAEARKMLGMNGGA